MVSDEFDKQIREKEEERSLLESAKYNITRLNQQLRAVTKQIKSKQEDLTKDFETEKEQQKEKIQQILAKQMEFVQQREKLLLEFFKHQICKDVIKSAILKKEEELIEVKEQYQQYLSRKAKLEEEKKRYEGEKVQLKKRMDEYKVISAEMS